MPLDAGKAYICALEPPCRTNGFRRRKPGFSACALKLRALALYNEREQEKNVTAGEQTQLFVKHLCFLLIKYEIRAGFPPFEAYYV